MAIAVSIVGKYDGKDIARAQRELNALAKQAGVTQGRASGLGSSLDGLNKQAAGLGASWKAAAVGIGTGFVAMAGAQQVTTYLKDAASAAIEDQAAVTALARAMDNVGVGSQLQSAQAYVDKLGLLYGVSDNEARPALQRLVTVTRDLGQAQDLTNIAMDVAAGTGKSLESVSTALAKAAGGQTTALGRLVPGLDQATLKSGDLSKITAELTNRYGGQAADAANTYEGRLRRISVAADEAQETIGYSLLGALDRITVAMGGSDGATEMVGEFGEGVAGLVTGISMLLEPLARIARGQKGAADATADAADENDNWVRGALQMIPVIGSYAAAIQQMGEADNIRQNFGAGGPMNSSGMAGHTQTAGFNRTQALSAVNSATASINAAWAKLRKANDAGKAVARRELQAALAGAQDIADRAIEIGARDQAGKFMNLISGAQKAAFASNSSGASGAAKKAAEPMKLVWSQIGKDASDGLDALQLIITGKTDTVTGKMVDQYKGRFSAFKDVVSEQSKIITDARKALDDYSASVVDTIMGKIDFQQTDAEGNPLTPEQVVTMILGDTAKQAQAVQALADSGVMTQLPGALAQKILTMPPDAAVGLANYLSANPAMLTQLATNYTTLATTTKTLLGDPMAVTFAEVGGESAVKMIEKAKQTIAQNSAAFTKWVHNNLDTSITVDVVYRDINKPGGGTLTIDGARAAGGPTRAGGTYLVGEKGPELLTMGGDGFVTPNSMLRGDGGSPTVINVNIYPQGSIMTERDVTDVVWDGIAQGMRRRGLDASVIGR